MSKKDKKVTVTKAELVCISCGRTIEQFVKTIGQLREWQVYGKCGDCLKKKNHRGLNGYEQQE